MSRTTTQQGERRLAQDIQAADGSIGLSRAQVNLIRQGLEREAEHRSAYGQDLENDARREGGLHKPTESQRAELLRRSRREYDIAREALDLAKLLRDCDHVTVSGGGAR